VASDGASTLFVDFGLTLGERLREETQSRGDGDEAESPHGDDEWFRCTMVVRTFNSITIKPKAASAQQYGTRNRVLDECDDPKLCRKSKAIKSTTTDEGRRATT
jgi:hypothetical protein